jgi:hypothetical protein
MKSVAKITRLLTNGIIFDLARIWHAVNHAFIAQRDNGDCMFNVSECLGTTSVIVLSNTHHPGNERGFGPAVRQVGYHIITGIGFDALCEFWPEIARKFRLPVRLEPMPDNVEANSAIR